MMRSKTFARATVAAVVLSILAAAKLVGAPAWPEPGGPPSSGGARPAREDAAGVAAEDASVVRALPVCVASDGWSAGVLGRTVLFRAKRSGRSMTVGYFVYWTTERPWGANLLTYSLLPALLIDAFYTHFLFVFPGAQRFIYGPGDVEGARVVYQQSDDGRWVPVSAAADDSSHAAVALAADGFVDGDGRVVLMTNVWSHQLGAAGARQFAATHRQHVVCYQGQALAPLTADVGRIFRLGSVAQPRRAPPAWSF
jgi:hypothetical protein